MQKTLMHIENAVQAVAANHSLITAATPGRINGSGIRPTLHPNSCTESASSSAALRDLGGPDPVRGFDRQRPLNPAEPPRSRRCCLGDSEGPSVHVFNQLTRQSEIAAVVKKHWPHRGGK